MNKLGLEINRPGREAAGPIGEMFFIAKGHNESRFKPMPYFILGSKRILFIHVPKTAGSTIKEHLSREGECRFDAPFELSDRKIWPRHQPGEVLDQIFVSDMFDFAFMMVRHPVTRLVSEYRYQRRKRGLHLANFLGFGAWLRYNLIRFRLNASWRDHHFRTQSSFEALGCRVFRLEDGLDAPMTALKSQTGLALGDILAVSNSSPRIPVQITRKDLNLIARVYKPDFDRYGYEIDIPRDL